MYSSRFTWPACFWTQSRELKYWNSIWSCKDLLFLFVALLHSPFLLSASHTHQLILYILYSAAFFFFFSVFLSLFISYIFSPPSGPVELSSVCGGVSPVPPVLSLSRSIKRRRTHAGCLKSPPTLPYGWWTGRCSNRTTLSRQEELPSHLLLYPCH